MSDHDASVFSKFHVILSTSGIQEGTNVFSFEIHRPLSGSSSDPVVFDATGVFGVEDCSTVVELALVTCHRYLRNPARATGTEI